MPEAKRILVLAPHASVTTRLREAADKLALETVLGCSDDSGALKIDFSVRDSALQIVDFVHQNPVAAIIPVGDETAPAAARGASMIGIPFHTPRAADACLDKKSLHPRLQAAGIATADLSATTLECIVSNGKLRVLASVLGSDVKPPEALPREDQKKIVEILKQMGATFGLKHGPVRVELSNDIAVVDVSLSCQAPPATDGLRFKIPLVDQDLSYEEVIIRNALELDISRVHLDQK